METCPYSIYQNRFENIVYKCIYYFSFYLGWIEWISIQFIYNFHFLSFQMLDQYHTIFYNYYYYNYLLWFSNFPLSFIFFHFCFWIWHQFIAVVIGAFKNLKIKMNKDAIKMKKDWKKDYALAKQLYLYIKLLMN